LDSTREIALGAGEKVNEKLGFEGSWVYAANKGASLQFRYAPAEVVVTPVKGSLAVLVVPLANLSDIKPYPIVHPLHAHSSLDLTKTNPYVKANISVQLFEVAPGQRVRIPPMSPYRLIALEDKTVWVLSDVFSKAKEVLMAKHKAYTGLPKYLQPNALVDQPLFFGMWTLAIYNDVLLGVNAKNSTERVEQRESLTHLTQLLVDRWGPWSPRLGHADDYRDYGMHAPEVIQNVVAECAEMKQVIRLL
jgi:hypothetical protein